MVCLQIFVGVLLSAKAALNEVCMRVFNKYQSLKRSVIVNTK